MPARTKHRRWLAVVAGTTALILSGPSALAAPGGGGHEDESPGNNLAVPVVWSETSDAGARPVLRGLGPQTEDLTLDADPAAHVLVGEDELFLQKTLNTWQAENADAAALPGLSMMDGKVNATWVDWGDNLEAKDWRTGMQVRVETKLMQDVSAVNDAADSSTGMTGYSMKKISGKGPDESWGVVGLQDADVWHAEQIQAVQAFLHTSHACLTIERIDNADSVAWNEQTRQWTGAGSVNCLGDVTEGPGGFKTEVTVSGGMTYGFVWPTKAIPAGLYRLTFSLKPESGVDFTDTTSIAVPIEEDHSSVLEAAASGGKPSGNTAKLDPANNLSYIDVALSYDDTRATRPLDLKATRDVGAIALDWKPPASSGSGPVIEYLVRGKRVDGGAALPETTVAADKALAATYLGLTGGEPYEFTVQAVTEAGPGDSAAVVATPKGQLQQPTDPVGVPADPGGDQAAQRMKRTLKLWIRAHASKRIHVKAFGEVLNKGQKLRTRTTVSLWFNPVGKDRPARVVKQMRTNSKGEYSTRLRLRRAGSLFTTVAQNDTALAARSQVYKVRIAH
jgi:hypothetical protein